MSKISQHTSVAAALDVVEVRLARFLVCLALAGCKGLDCKGLVCKGLDCSNGCLI